MPIGPHARFSDPAPPRAAVAALRAITQLRPQLAELDHVAVQAAREKGHLGEVATTMGITIRRHR
jgi:hypothetical protein